VSYTFKTLQDEVLAHGFDSSYRSRIKAWINEGRAVAERRVRLRTLETTLTRTTTAGATTVPLPADFMYMRGITVTSTGEELSPVSIQWMDSLVTGNASPSTGRPAYYCLDVGSVRLWPVPDAAYSLLLRYDTEPTDMANDTDDPAFPADYQHILISYAIARAFRAEDDQERAASFMADYERGLAEMASSYRRETSGPKQVPGMWGSLRQRYPADMG
jgi:hypothetical protein